LAIYPFEEERFFSPSAMFLGSLSSYSNAETAHLFASYIKANFESTAA